MATLGISEAEREAINRFDRDVIKPSLAGLILLQFTASWCGPCKQLSPILDKVAADYAAKGVRLVRLDVDQERIIAAQFRIQSVPTVYAFFQGQPVADLTNYRTEGQITRVLDQLLAQLPVSTEGDAPEVDVEPHLAMGEQLLESGDATQAERLFKQILEVLPERPEALGGLARSLIVQGRVDEARELLTSLPEAIGKAQPIVRARAALDLASTAPASGTADLEQRLAANADDHEARFELAASYASNGDRDRAADALLEIVARDKEWNDGAARQRLLQLIEAQGLEDPWARAQRRRLSALLFT